MRILPTSDPQFLADSDTHRRWLSSFQKSDRLGHFSTNFMRSDRGLTCWGLFILGLHSSVASRLLELIRRGHRASQLPAYQSVSTTLELETALADTSVGRIVLSAGRYMLSAELRIDRDVTIEAEEPGSAEFDGQGVVRVLYITGGIVALSGLNITGGYASSSHSGGPQGGGVRVDGGRVMFRTCRFYRNRVGAWGGAAFISRGHATFEDCFMHENDAPNGGGGAYIRDAQVIFRNCDINSNRATGGVGGGAYVLGGQVVFDGCRAHGNSAAGAGALIVFGGSVSVDQCYIHGNTADDGGALYINGGQVQITGSEIYNNAAASGAGLNIQGESRVVVSTSNFYRNRATSNGGAFYTSTRNGGTVDVSHSSVYDNTANYVRP